MAEGSRSIVAVLVPARARMWRIWRGEVDLAGFRVRP